MLLHCSCLCSKEKKGAAPASDALAAMTAGYSEIGGKNRDSDEEIYSKPFDPRADAQRKARAAQAVREREQRLHTEAVRRGLVGAAKPLKEEEAEPKPRRNWR